MMTMDNNTGGESSAVFDTLTPEEAAYFESGGTKIDGLDLSESTGPRETVTEQVADQREVAPDGKTEADELGDGDEITYDSQGRPHGKDGKFVPHQALHKERERHKETRQQLETYRERQARADERLAVLNEIMGKVDAPAGKGKGADEQQVIDPETDPLGALTQALTKIQSLEKQLQERDAQQGEKESARAMQTAYMNDAQKYVQEKPEFKDAYKFLIEGMHRELEVMGVTDPAERNRHIAQEERNFVSRAMQSRRSPAQMLHNLAVARGFVPKESPAGGKQPNGHAEKIERIANGQRQAGVSLSNAGGSSGEGLTAAALADMSEAEFEAMSAKLGKAKMRQLLGG